jgi:pyocin large subunit-like protein
LPGSSAVRFAVCGALFALLALPPVYAGGKGFRTHHLLEEHYGKYGGQFGSIRQDRYLQMAQQLRDARPGKNVLVTKFPGGAVAKFDKRYGWFVAYDADGTLRTFFVPKEGIRYVARQGGNQIAPE